MPEAAPEVQYQRLLFHVDKAQRELKALDDEDRRVFRGEMLKSIIAGIGGALLALVRVVDIATAKQPSMASLEWRVHLDTARNDGSYYLTAAQNHMENAAQLDDRIKRLSQDSAERPNLLKSYQQQKSMTGAMLDLARHEAKNIRWLLEHRGAPLPERKRNWKRRYKPTPS